MKKIISGIKKYWFITLFFLFLSYCLYGNAIDKKFELSGVINEVESVSFNWDSVMDGTFQNYMNTWWEQNFPGRKLMIHFRNEILYSICKESPNSNVIIGKHQYLFEPNYINRELHLDNDLNDDYFNELETKMIKLRNELEQNGKELFVFITPSKAHFYKKEIPTKYRLLENDSATGREEHNYLIRILEKNDIHYYDSVQYLEKNKGKFRSPYFYKSGIHWSHVWGESAAAEFLDYISENSKYDMASIEVTEVESDEPIYPDTDLFDSLNLFSRPKDKWYTTDIKVSEGKDKPNVFYRGGSFMGQSLNRLIYSGVFSRDVHLENSYYFTDQYSTTTNISAFDAYDEMDLDVLVGQSDIIVLEVNDAKIYDMSFGFIDYLLEHTEYLDYKY